MKCFKNKHKLPPHGINKELDENSSSINLYGDIFILKKNKNFISIDISEYGEFYNYMFDDIYDSIIEEENEDILINSDMDTLNEEEEDETDKIEYDNFNEDEELDINDENNDNEEKNKIIMIKKDIIKDNNTDNDNELEEDLTNY